MTRVLQFKVHVDLIYTILNALIDVGYKINYVGCDEHKVKLTRRVIEFYVIIRTKKFVQAYNEQQDAIAKKSRELRKQSKMNMGFNPNSDVDPNDWSEGPRDGTWIEKFKIIYSKNFQYIS